MFEGDPVLTTFKGSLSPEANAFVSVIAFPAFEAFAAVTPFEVQKAAKKAKRFFCVQTGENGDALHPELYGISSDDIRKVTTQVNGECVKSYSVEIFTTNKNFKMSRAKINYLMSKSDFAKVRENEDQTLSMEAMNAAEKPKVVGETQQYPFKIFRRMDNDSIQLSIPAMEISGMDPERAEHFYILVTPGDGGKPTFISQVIIPKKECEPFSNLLARLQVMPKPKKESKQKNEAVQQQESQPKKEAKPLVEYHEGPTFGNLLNLLNQENDEWAHGNKPTYLGAPLENLKGMFALNSAPTPLRDRRVSGQRQLARRSMGNAFDGTLVLTLDTNEATYATHNKKLAQAREELADRQAKAGDAPDLSTDRASALLPQGQPKVESHDEDGGEVMVRSPILSPNRPSLPLHASRPSAQSVGLGGRQAGVLSSKRQANVNNAAAQEEVLEIAQKPSIPAISGPDGRSLKRGSGTHNVYAGVSGIEGAHGNRLTRGSGHLNKQDVTQLLADTDDASHDENKKSAEVRSESKRRQPPPPPPISDANADNAENKSESEAEVVSQGSSIPAAPNDSSVSKSNIPFDAPPLSVDLTEKLKDKPMVISKRSSVNAKKSGAGSKGIGIGRPSDEVAETSSNRDETEAASNSAPAKHARGGSQPSAGGDLMAEMMAKHARTNSGQTQKDGKPPRPPSRSLGKPYIPPMTILSPANNSNSPGTPVSPGTANSPGVQSKAQGSPKLNSVSISSAGVLQQPATVATVASNPGSGIRKFSAPKKASVSDASKLLSPRPSTPSQDSPSDLPENAKPKPAEAPKLAPKRPGPPRPPAKPHPDTAIADEGDNGEDVGNNGANAENNQANTEMPKRPAPRPPAKAANESGNAQQPSRRPPPPKPPVDTSANGSGNEETVERRPSPQPQAMVFSNNAPGSSSKPGPRPPARPPAKASVSTQSASVVGESASNNSGNVGNNADNAAYTPIRRPSSNPPKYTPPGS